MTCIIVEDEPLARKLIEDYIRQALDLELLGSFGNPLKALEFLRENPVDLLFTDIQMKEITGLSLLRLIQRKPLVILTTAYSEYALDGFELDVVDYLLKPVTFERFLKAVEKAEVRFKGRTIETATTQVMNAPNTDEFIFLKDGTKLLKVKLTDILYVQGLKDYVRVITKEKQIVSLNTMKSMEENLPSDRFIRIHHSTIVALAAIEEIERDHVKIKDKFLPISDSYKKSFKDFVDKYRV